MITEDNFNPLGNRNEPWIIDVYYSFFLNDPKNPYSNIFHSLRIDQLERMKIALHLLTHSAHFKYFCWANNFDPERERMKLIGFLSPALGVDGEFLIDDDGNKRDIEEMTRVERINLSNPE